MSRFFVSMIALPLMLIGLATTPVTADMDQKDRAEMQQVIEQYIKNNPEVLRDALVSLAAREEAERVQAGIMLVRNDAGDPVMGNPNGSLTVYEFSDYNCGYCKRMFAPIMQMLAANGDVRLVVKEFPILSQSSVTAAKAGIAAQKQGKFKSFHTEMMIIISVWNDLNFPCFWAAIPALAAVTDDWLRIGNSLTTKRTSPFAASICMIGANMRLQ